MSGICGGVDYPLGLACPRPFAFTGYHVALPWPHVLGAMFAGQGAGACCLSLFLCWLVAWSLGNALQPALFAALADGEGVA